jgi:glycosyltransferase involved in cell wall biosynthesis
LKISLITVVYNARDTIDKCIRSVAAQSHTDIEYIIIDGGSTDGSLEIINHFKAHIHIFVSEPDHGIYDAMNKGIILSSGDIIGTLNADDYFADESALSAVAQSFSSSGVDIVYGNLDYVNKRGDITRKWHSQQCGNNSFNWGFMPPHPTFYCKRELFGKFGSYSLEYGSAGDYELMARFMHQYRASSCYLDKVMVKMLNGGVSNGSLKNRFSAWGADFRAMRRNGLRYPLLALFLKPLRKLGQFF